MSNFNAIISKVQQISMLYIQITTITLIVTINLPQITTAPTNTQHVLVRTAVHQTYSYL